MSFCPKCGSNVADGLKFCPNCGTAIQAVAPTQAPQSAQPFTPQAAPQPVQPVPPVAPQAAPQATPQASPQATPVPPAYPQSAPQGPGSQMYYDPQPQPQPQPQQQFVQNNFYQTAGRPAKQLKTNRGLLKVILLSMITFGIYGLVVMSEVSTSINTIASRYDGKKTMHALLVVFVFSWLTLGIVPLVWSHKISARIGDELRRRGIDYSFGAGTFWGWSVLGALIIVGPFIFCHKLLKSMNLLSESYNLIG